MTRFLLYSHDTYGLGHFRRSTVIATSLTSRDSSNEVLIVTGSPRAQAFRLPERVDTLKLPTATKDDRGSYRPRKLSGGLGHLVELRSQLIWTAVERYRPDVILVDHSPLGMCGELRTTIAKLARARYAPRLVLGLRDVIDEASAVDRQWHREGVWDVLADYDQIMVYGDPEVGTTAAELGMARRTSASVSHTGYLAPAMPDPVAGDPFVLVTTGGGGDGNALLHAYLGAVKVGAVDGVRSIVVTGPLLSSKRRATLEMQAARHPSVELIDFAPNMRSLISSATGVVSMAGYNTVVEELAAQAPALLIPRHTPRLEQTLRAQRLVGRTALEHCTVDELTPERVAAFVARSHSYRREAPQIDLCGISTATNHLISPALEGNELLHA